MKSFYNTGDYSLPEIQDMIKLALELKGGNTKKTLSGKVLAMLFFNPSLRTRVSFIVAMQKLGGTALDLPIKDGSYTFEFEDGVVMAGNTIEHVREAARVLSRYADCIAVRSSDLITSGKESVVVSGWKELKADTVLKSFMRYATVPVINMESNVYHPCQGLADAMTIVEKLGSVKKKKYVLSWVPHPKALPMATPNSQMLSACQLGMDVTVVCPVGWELDQDITKAAQNISEKAGGTFSLSHNQKEALQGAEIVTAKSWGALKFYGHWDKEKILRAKYKDWIIDKRKMSLTEHGYFMHCLPIRRNVEATDEVLDGGNSLIYDEAENRMWAQMVILLHLL